MAYVYLLDMNKFVEQRLAGTKEALENNTSDPSEKKFIEDAPGFYRIFRISSWNNYIPKLPRRIRETYLNRDN